MMDPVADNERNEPGAPPAPPPSPNPTTPPAGVPAAPPPAPHAEPGPPPAMRQPTEITPEQIRQFQEFQRFQALMKEQAEKGLPPATPPPGHLQPWGPPPPKQSLLKRLLKAAIGKIVTALVVVALLALAGYLAIDYFLKDDLEDHPTARDTGGEGATANLIYEESPLLAVRRIYDDIAQGDATSTCGRFEEAARKEFTKNMSQYGDTCEEIVNTIHNAVAAEGMKSEYGDPWIPASAVPANQDPVSVSSCAIEVIGGPRLGLFTLSTIPNSDGPGGQPQWIVSGHASEPTDCGGTSSTPPTS